MSVTCTPKIKNRFYKQQNYFEKMMGIMLEWYHLVIGMQTTVLNMLLNAGISNLLGSSAGGIKNTFPNNH